MPSLIVSRMPSAAFKAWASVLYFSMVPTVKPLVGVFALAAAICAPVVMLTGLQLRSVQATDVRREYRFEEYFTLRVVCCCASFLMIFAVAVLAGYKWAAIRVI